MNRLFAAVAVSALALSGAAFAADAPATSPTLVQKAQAPTTATTTSPAKPAVVKKADNKAITGTASSAPAIK